jgi:hypothetical protein
VDPEQAPKIGELLGVQGVVILRGGSSRYKGTSQLFGSGCYQLTGKPPDGVKLVDATTARVVWNYATPETDKEPKPGQDASADIADSLGAMLKAAGWRWCPPKSLVRREPGQLAALDPSLAPGRLRAGVYPFKADPVLGGDQNWADKFSNVLLQTGYDVIDRAQLQTVIKEQRLANSGLVKPEQMVRLGRIAGIQALVVGAVSDSSCHAPLCAYAARLIDVATGAAYWSAYGQGCDLSNLADSLGSALSAAGGRK